MPGKTPVLQFQRMMLNRSLFYLGLVTAVLGSSADGSVRPRPVNVHHVIESHAARMLDLPQRFPASEDDEDGYLNDVVSEVPSEPREMLLLQRPEGLDGPTFHDYLFNAQLSAEFRDRYRERFARTESESYYYLTNQYGYYRSSYGLSTQQEDSQRREFAEYMGKRLAEFHVENYMKTNPRLRPVYEIKQKISNVNLAITPTTRFDMSYSFVGNFARATLTNPIVDLSGVVNMNPKGLTPSTPEEITVTARRPITSNLTTEASYAVNDRSVRVALIRYWGAWLSASASQVVRLTNGNIDPSRDSVSLLGLNLIF